MSGRMVDLSRAMTNGDCLVIARHDGRFEVFKLWAEGARQRIDMEIEDTQTAWQVAHTRLEPDGSAVYYKEETEPDSEIRLYPSQALRMTYGGSV
jgi:hypothetical protein